MTKCMKNRHFLRKNKSAAFTIQKKINTLPEYNQEYLGIM